MNAFARNTWILLGLVAAIFLFAWFWAALAPRGVSPEATRYFSSDFIARARSYQQSRYLTYGASVGLEIFILLLLAGTSLGETLANSIRPWAGGRRVLETFYLLSLFFAGLALVNLPLAFYRGYILEHAYALSNQTAGSWLRDYLLSSAINLVLTVPTLTIFYLLLKKVPHYWPWLAAGLYTAGLALLFMLSPLVIDPLFYHFRPVENPQIRQEVLQLAARAGIPVDEVLEMDASRRTNKVNAYFTGLGQTKRIVLYDNLLQKYPPDEVALVLAHEMGHWRAAHIWKGLLLGGLGTLFSLLVLQRVLAGMKGYPSLSPEPKPASLFLILLFFALWLFISQPLQNAVSRAFEREADATALSLTGDRTGQVALEKRLAEHNLADVDPHPFIKWFAFTHPSALERIEAAENFR